MYINISKIDFGRCYSGGSGGGGEVVEYYGMYVTPADASAISVTPNDSYYTLHGKYLKYSFDSKTWNDWYSSVTIEPAQKMYLKGEDDYVWNSSTSGKLITSNGNYNVGGDISSLTNEIADVKDYTFYNLFNEDAYIKDASNLILPATTLASYCYYRMFVSCSLTTAPALPATMLADNCYESMFSGCTSLNTAPALPATELTLNCYRDMFGGCSSLTTAPELPATTLADNCYGNMFSSCTSLNTAPALPATTLAPYCYSSMFSDCTSLTAAPELSATTLTDHCYDSIFSGCYSLTTAPALPATTLANSCYSYIFMNCISLTTAPELPATTLADYCYTYMFKGCTSLTTAPELPATTLAQHCYEYMFSSCTSLTTAPELPATTLVFNCYSHMFINCTSLTNAPKLPATTLVGNCYDGMFFSCTSLTTAPALHATTLQRACYREMFYGCTNLKNITMLATDISAPFCLGQWVNGVSSTGTFTKSPEMTSLPTGESGIPSGWTVVDYTEYMTLSALGDGEITITIPAEINSTYATSLSYSKDKATWTETLIDDTAQTISIPVTSGENVYLKGIAKQLGKYNSFININASAGINASGNIMSLLYGDDYKDKVAFQAGSEYTFNSLFSGNTHLINAKDLVLPATTAASTCYYYMFKGCTSLTNAPKLPATTLTNGCYRFMFQGCTSLTTSPELPATTLADYCYASMFDGCTSLTTAPVLPATTLTNGCYMFMFQGCTSLTTAPELPATTLTSSCYSEMFYGCSNLNSITMLATDISASGCLLTWVGGVAPTGTFTKAASMTSLPAGQSGIPEGWTVKDYGDSGGGYSKEYFTITALGDGTITLSGLDRVIPQYLHNLSYSTDKNYWEVVQPDPTFDIPVSIGDNVYFKGSGIQTALNVTDALTINSDCNINVSGNIMSLLDEDIFTDMTEFPGGSKFTFVNLFKNNTHLISAENLILPATTLVERCYQYMFRGCSSLTTAPVLPATTLVTSCYYGMFIGCTSLNNITMLATDISAKNCLSNWANGVAETGTLTKSPEMTSLVEGPGGIPLGWTVVDYGAA